MAVTDSEQAGAQTDTKFVIPLWVMTTAINFLEDNDEASTMVQAEGIALEILKCLPVVQSVRVLSDRSIAVVFAKPFQGKCNLCEPF